MLFSEPKIPQSNFNIDDGETAEEFQCSSASRKFLNRTPTPTQRQKRICFSALQRAENSSIEELEIREKMRNGFSALQRAENSSIFRWLDFGCDALHMFQCSSASRKFLNRQKNTTHSSSAERFSALQRAENSSIIIA